MSGRIDKLSSEHDKHNGDITCVQIFNHKIYSGGADGRIKIWDQELKLLRDIPAHASYIYALALDSQGKLYSSCCDGTINLFEKPLESDDSKKLLECGDDLLSLVVDNDILYCGDDKGVVTTFENGKIKLRFNLVEEVKSLAVMNKYIYSIRDNDLTITECLEGVLEKYVTKATIPGKSPVILFDNKSLICILTREGTGFKILRNDPKALYKVLATTENAHEMIINSICGDSHLYTGCYNGKVKRWIDIETAPTLSGEVNIGNCINTMCSSGTNNVVYCGNTDGILRKIVFS